MASKWVYTVSSTHTHTHTTYVRRVMWLRDVIGMRANIYSRIHNPHFNRRMQGLCQRTFHYYYLECVFFCVFVAFLEDLPSAATRKLVAFL